MRDLLRKPARPVLAVALLALLLAGAPARAKLPAVETPDFASASAVRASIDGMLEALEDLGEGAGWRALRARYECATARDLVRWRATAAAYDAQAGETTWRTCHDAYDQAE